jgi:hypothetical protein
MWLGSFDGLAVRMARGRQVLAIVVCVAVRAP